MTNVSLLRSPRLRPSGAGPNSAGQESAGQEAVALDADGVPDSPVPDSPVPDPPVPDPPDEPLPGSICEQFIRCGKPNCRCYKGKLHGPYYYRIWRGEGGAVHKVYVKKEDVARVRQQCESYLALSTELRAAIAKAGALRARLAGQIRWFCSLRQQRLDGDKKQLARNKERLR